MGLADFVGKLDGEEIVSGNGRFVPNIQEVSKRWFAVSIDVDELMADYVIWKSW